MFGKKGGGNPMPVPVAGPPVKTSFDIQREAEEERIRLAASTRGFAANFFSAGFGTTSVRTPAPTLGVSLGAR